MIPEAYRTVTPGKIRLLFFTFSREPCVTKNHSTVFTNGIIRTLTELGTTPFGGSDGAQSLLHPPWQFNPDGRPLRCRRPVCGGLICFCGTSSARWAVSGGTVRRNRPSETAFVIPLEEGPNPQTTNVSAEELKGMRVTATREPAAAQAADRPAARRVRMDSHRRGAEGQPRSGQPRVDSSARTPAFVQQRRAVLRNQKTESNSIPAARSRPASSKKTPTSTSTTSANGNWPT